MEQFVLDITFFSTIIYLSYEDGELKPSLVRFERFLSHVLVSRKPGRKGG